MFQLGSVFVYRIPPIPCFFSQNGPGNSLWTQRVLASERFAATSQNFVFDRDVVPRLPGSPGFYRDALRTAITTATSYGAERTAPKW